MGYKDRFLAGEFPESGAIFMCNKRTKEECFRRKLFGLPSNMTDFVLNVRKGMTLFLFEYESRLLHGVFRATSDGEINIDPEAFHSSGKYFPAQICFSTVTHCIPLEEYEFKYIIKDNYFSANKFRFGLNEKQVSKLLNLFRPKKVSEKRPERSGDARYDNHRKNLFQNRLSSRNKEDREFEREDVKKIDYHYKPFDRHYHEIDVGRKDEKFLVDGMDCNRFRFQDENSVSEGSRKSLSSYHLGSPHDRRSGTVTDKYSFGLETVESEPKPLNEYLLSKTSYDGSCTLRPLTLTEQTFSKQREISFGPRADDGDDGSFRFRSVAPTTYSSIREPILTHDSSSFIPINDSSFYPSSKKISTFLPMTKSPSYRSHSEGSDRYFDDLDYALLGKRQHIVEENREEREFKTVSREGSYNPLFPDFISKRLPSSDSSFCLRKEESIGDDSFRQQGERKYLFGTDKRVSVFARLNSALKHGEQESETDEKHELDASVNKVMRMLEKVVSSPIRRKGKSKSAFKDDADDDNSRDSAIVDYELPDVQMKLDSDLADDVGVDESVIPETRLLDYNRRKKPVKSIDGSEMPTKRRKIVRPSFNEKKFTAADGTSFIDGSLSAKVIPENPEKVDAAIESLDITMLSSNSEELSVAKDDNNSTIKVDAFMKSMEEIIMQSHNHENSADDSKSTKALLESSKKVDTFIDIAMQPTADDITPTKDVSNSLEAFVESSEKVEAVEVCLEDEKDGKSVSGIGLLCGSEPVGSVKDEQKMCGWIEW